ncbi:hypothetical protein QZH41_016704, partial [Actinostola sp. cb2023]
SPSQLFRYRSKAITMLCCKKKSLDKKPEPLVEYPDGGWGWIVCLATFVTQFIVLGTMNNFGVMYVELLKEFKVGKAEAAWVGSITYGMMFLLGPIRLATLQGVDMFNATLLIGMMSVGSTVGRLFFGKIADHPKVNRLYLYQFSFLMIGISNTICPLMKTYGGLAFYATFFGFFEGCYVLLAPVLTGDIVGRNNMATGVGVLFAVKSIPLTLGPPIAGFIYDASNSYEVAFYIAGAVPIIAACLMFTIPFLMPKEDHPDCTEYGKFEVIMEEKDHESEDRSSGYDSQLRIPQMSVEPPTPTLLPESLKAESLPYLPPLIHDPNGLSGDHTEAHLIPLPRRLRPHSIYSVRSLTGSHLSVNSILSRAGPSTLTLPAIQENGDGSRCTVRTAGLLDLQRELSPSVFSLVRRRLDLHMPKQAPTLAVPKLISASRYGGSIGCISVPGDAAPIAYDQAVADIEEQEKEVMIGNVTSV